MSAAVIVVCNWVLETKVVVRALPFHWTVEDDAKFVPATVSVKGPLPVTAEPGFKLAMLGGGGWTVKVTPLLATPPTLTTTTPVLAPAGTGTTMPVSLQLFGIAGVPLNLTVLVPLFAPKFVPVMVTSAPTRPEVGLRLVIVGQVLSPPLAALNAPPPSPHF